jgi:hypothetical protein
MPFTIGHRMSYGRQQDVEKETGIDPFPEGVGKIPPDGGETQCFIYHQGINQIGRIAKIVKSTRNTLVIEEIVIN